MAAKRPGRASGVTGPGTQLRQATFHRVARGTVGGRKRLRRTSHGSASTQRGFPKIHRDRKCTTRSRIKSRAFPTWDQSRFREGPKLGLPGIAVQIVDPKNEKAGLVESFTDQDGNAVLSVPADLAKQLDKRDTTLQITDNAGKSLAKLPNAVCIRVGQTETRVVKLPDSAAIAEQKRLALETRDERETQARNLAGRRDVLKNERQKVLEELDCRLQDNEAIIAELEKPETPGTVEPAKESDDPADPETGPATAGKRRKK